MATNKCTLKLLHIKLRAANLGMPEAHECTTIYNNKAAAVSWASLLMNKGSKHTNLDKKKFREVCAEGGGVVKHIPGIINPSDICTKEIKYMAHFRRLCDIVMVSKANFLHFHHVVPSHISGTKTLPYYSIHSPTPASA